MHRFAGIYTPLATPFAADGSLDAKGLARNVEKYLRTPLTGLVVLGSNGEAPQLEEHEADLAISTVRDAMPPDRPLLAGTGRESVTGRDGELYSHSIEPFVLVLGRDAPTDRRSTSWQLPRQRLVDHGDAWRRLTVRRRQVAARNDRNSHRFGMPWCDEVDVHAHFVLSGRRARRNAGENRGCTGAMQSRARRRARVGRRVAFTLGRRRDPAPGAWRRPG